MSTLPEPIQAIVRRSPGRIFCRKQAFKAGFGDGNLDRWLRKGLIERLAPGWYRMVGDVVPCDQLAWLAWEYLRLSSSRPLPAISGEVALAELGVPGFDIGARPLVLVHHGDRVRVADCPFDVRTADLRELGRLHVRTLPVVDPARALADLHVPGRWDLDALINGVDRVRNHLRIDVLELMASWERMTAAHPGIALLLQLAHDGVFDVESGGERNALEAVFRHCRGGMPDCQVVVLGQLRADFAYLFSGVLIEYHGRESHRGRVEEDATRTMALQRAGFVVIVLTRSMVLDDPVGTAAHIDEVREQREALMLRGELRRPSLPVQPARRAPLRTLVPTG